MRTLNHPAAPLLKEYASQGCPVDVGRDWTLEELEAAMKKGPHASALEPFDPSTEKNLVCHPNLPLFAVTNAYKGKPSVVMQATGDLVCTAFYYLLRIEEYTMKTKRKKKTRTQQFRVKDLTFFKYGKDGKLQPLASDATDEEILSAEAATLRISNQKNVHAGICIHHLPHSNCGKQGSMPSQGAGKTVHPHKAKHKEQKRLYLHVL